jgi:hypothetical protein
VFSDSARYLPGNVSVTAIAGTFWNSDRESVATGFHVVPKPNSDSLNPVYAHMHVVGVGADGNGLKNPTTSLLLEVW